MKSLLGQWSNPSLKRSANGGPLGPGMASRRRRPLSSNIRPHNMPLSCPFWRCTAWRDWNARSNSGCEGQVIGAPHATYL